MPYISSEKLKQLQFQTSVILTLIGEIENSTHIKIDYPFSGKYGISQKFGENPALYIAYGYKGHFGLDFLTPHGLPIMACDDGVVSRVGFTTGNGNFIELKHSWGLSFYCHFKDASTHILGQRVCRGDVIGLCGNTGRVFSDKPLSDKTRGTHLHFSIKINGISNPDYKDFVDPLPFFKN